MWSWARDTSAEASTVSEESMFMNPAAMTSPVPVGSWACRATSAAATSAQKASAGNAK